MDLRRARAAFVAGGVRAVRAWALHLQSDHRASRPTAVILFGSPGSGKGTQAKLLKQRLGIPHVSTGDMLRAHISEGDAIGLTSHQLIKAGKLVPDELVNQLVRHRLSAPDAQAGVILDGYPRTLNQGRALQELLGELQFRPAVVYLVVDYEHIVARLSGRRQCPLCGTLYSLTTHPPKISGVCDLDGRALVTRDDDREAVIRERLLEYDRQTVPILNFMRQLGVPLFEIEASDAPPEQIKEQICRVLNTSGMVEAAAENVKSV